MIYNIKISLRIIKRCISLFKRKQREERIVILYSYYFYSKAWLRLEPRFCPYKERERERLNEVK